jgi:hypothetical protein
VLKNTSVFTLNNRQLSTAVKPDKLQFSGYIARELYPFYWTDDMLLCYQPEGGRKTENLQLRKKCLRIGAFCGKTKVESWSVAGV